MQVATTIQFRNAVRTIATARAVSMPAHSWTEGAGKGSDVRYVGYPVYGMPRMDKVFFATAVERLLQAQGVTAKTRISKGGYLRGTGVIA
jgi:hypothetical protein